MGSGKQRSLRLSTASQHELAVGFRQLNYRQFCIRLPNTSTLMLSLSTRLHLNINLLPVVVSIIQEEKEHSVMFCGVSSTFDSHFKMVWSFNSISGKWPFYKAYQKKSVVQWQSQLDWPRLRSRPLSCSLKSVILWHKPLIQTKRRAVVFPCSQRLSRHLLTAINIQPSKVTFRR